MTRWCLQTSSRLWKTRRIVGRRAPILLNRVKISLCFDVFIKEALKNQKVTWASKPSLNKAGISQAQQRPPRRKTSSSSTPFSFRRFRETKELQIKGTEQHETALRSESMERSIRWWGRIRTSYCSLPSVTSLRKAHLENWRSRWLSMARRALA